MFGDEFEDSYPGPRPLPILHTSDLPFKNT
jgi:hypothetical protein